MFITGTISDFKDRLHQLPATVAEVDDFVAEGKTFASDLMPNILEQLEKEARLQKFRLSNDESYLNVPQF